MKLLINRFPVKYPVWFFKILLLCLVCSALSNCNSVDSLYRLKNDYLRSQQQEELLSSYEMSILSKKPVVEYLIDSKDSLSVQYYKHFKKLCDYTKIPFNYKLVDKFNEQLQIEHSTKVFVINSTKRLDNKVLPTLLKFVSKGGVLVFPNTVEDQRFMFFLGMRYDADLSYDVNSRGMCINSLVLGGKYELNLYKNIKHFAFAKANFKEDTKVHIWSDSHQEMPVLIENKLGSGKVIYCNSSKIFEKKDRGMLFSFLLKGLSGIPFPIANTSTVFLDDFPSPLYDVKKEPVKSEFNLTMNEFVYKKWWPDMKKLAQKYNLKYTAMLTFDYDDVRKAPFSFKQWDYAKIRTNKRIKKSTSNFLTRDLLRSKHELGFHGYNHVSLLKHEWKNPESIYFSLKTSRKKWLVNNFGDFPITYVPPSNTIDSYGISELKRGMPSLKYFSSLYLGDRNEGCDREFDIDPHHKDLFDYPRVSSGFYFDDEKNYNIFSTFLYTGIWTHFVHPDDVFQIRSSVEKQKKKYHYELRNDLGLNWKKGKKTLYGCFENFLSGFKEINPLSDFYTVKDATPLVMKWRASKFQHAIVGNKYTVSEDSDYFVKNGATWSVFFDDLNETNKQEIIKQASSYKINDFLQGKLVTLKSTNKLAFSCSESSFLDSASNQDVLEEYKLFEKKRADFLSGKFNSIVPEDYQKKIEAEKKSLLSLMMNQPVINYAIWNKYATYMSWENKGDVVWELLERHCEKYPSKHNVNYSFELAKILGYSSEDLHKKWIRNQYKWNAEKLSVLKEYLSIISGSDNFEEIKNVLYRIYELEPTFENQQAYIYHALLHAKEEAFAYLNKLDPATAHLDEKLVADICWSYINEKEDFQNAVLWSEFTSLISADIRLSWMYELRQYVEMERFYKNYIAAHPNDESVKQKMFQIYEALGKYNEACTVLLQIQDKKAFVAIKEHLNQQIVYLEIETQEELIRKYPTIFNGLTKEKVEMKLKDLYGDHLDANSALSYFLNKRTLFRSDLKYSHFDRSRNSHDFFVKYKELFSLSTITENNNIALYGLAYEFKSKQTDKINKFTYGYGLGLEKENSGQLYYNAKIGGNIFRKGSTVSTNFMFNPANFREAYRDNIYQLQWNSSYNKYFKLFEVDSYAVLDYYCKLSNVNMMLNSKIKSAYNKEKKFKMIPFLEATWQSSNIDEKVKLVPVYLIKNRFFGGGGLEAHLGDDHSRFNFHTSGAYYFDTFEDDFMSFKFNSACKIFRKSYLKLSADLNFKSKYNFSTFGVGYKYIF